MFRQHKREQHAKKFVVNSYFLIDAINLTYESMKISTINSSFFVSFLFANFDIFNSIRFHQNSEKKNDLIKSSFSCNIFNNVNIYVVNQNCSNE